MLKNRIKKIEESVRKREGNVFIIVAPADSTKDADIMEVTINGESRFVGTNEECDQWIDENLGHAEKITVISGEGDLQP